MIGNLAAPVLVKIVAGLAIALAVCGSGWALHASVLGARLDAAKASLKLAEGQRDSAIDANVLHQSATVELAARLATSERRWQEQAKAGAEAVDRAEKERARAESALATFRDRWERRSQSCGAALLDMQAACEADLGGY